jgi:lipopolysaccharide export system protein LptA
MLFKILFRSICCLFTVLPLQAKMTPSAPIQNFRLPRFADNGYTQWVLQGGKGIYDSAEQVRIEAMALRVYSGDERMALEMTLDSPQATVRIQENRAISDGPIEIVGANFKVSGVGWVWDGLTKTIEVNFDVVVEFTQGMGESLSVARVPEPGAKTTEIHSGRLVLQTTEEMYRFEFSQSVHVLSGDLDLKSDVLIAIADAPEGRQSGAPAVGGAGQLDAVRQVIARDQVVIEQGQRVLRAGHAEFLLREQRASFSGTPQIQTAGGYLSGATIHSREGEVIVTGGGDAGRAQMIVSQAGGLGIRGGAALSDETIVLADTITMRELETENRFVFDGSVEVMSGAVQLRSQALTLLAEHSTGSKRESASDDAARIGEVRQVIAEGGVRIEQEGQVATSRKVVFYPQEERAELIGDPRVSNREAIVVGEHMQLKPGLAIVEGGRDGLIDVILPVLPDLGYQRLEQSEVAADSGASADLPVPAVATSSETVIQARALHMIEAADHMMFRFSESVAVTATNLDASCARLEVIAREQSTTSDGRLQVEQIQAFDGVQIRQSGRVATGGQATILPIAGKVILEGNAVVTDERGRVSGHRMTLLQGERRAIVEGGGPSGARAKVTLPAIPSADF